MIISLFHNDVITDSCLDFDIGIANIWEQMRIHVISNYSIDHVYLTIYFSVCMCVSFFVFIYLYALKLICIIPQDVIHLNNNLLKLQSMHLNFASKNRLRTSSYVSYGLLFEMAFLIQIVEIVGSELTKHEDNPRQI